MNNDPGWPILPQTYLDRPSITEHVETAVRALYPHKAIVWRARVELDPGRMRLPLWSPGEPIPTGTIQLWCMPVDPPGRHSAPG